MQKIYLTASYAEKEEVKRLGAFFDGVQKRWYIFSDEPLEPFLKWLPASVNTESVPMTSRDPDTQTGISLSALLAMIKKNVHTAFPMPLWIKTEISQLITKTQGHFFSFVDIDEAGKSLAQLNGILWASKKNIIDLFEQTTQIKLGPGIKVLIRAIVDTHPIYGLQLIIQAIDPGFTLGDREATVKKIKHTLEKEGIFLNNRALLPPTDFTHIVVISPEQAAGLGDFHASAQQLTQYGLCDITYLTAVFQGNNGPASILQAIQQVFNKPDFLPDAIVLIRGGGSVTDLHWLNDEALARTICLCPVPVLTGIGHERDRTILDDIAHMSFSTPSKVIAYIIDRIKTQALSAQNNWSLICHEANNIMLKKANNIECFIQEIKNAVFLRLRMAEQNLVQKNAYIQYTISNKIIFFEHKCADLMAIIQAYSPTNILRQGFAMVKNMQGMTVKSVSNIISEQIINIYFQDGSIRAKILSKNDIKNDTGENSHEN